MEPQTRPQFSPPRQAPVMPPQQGWVMPQQAPAMPPTAPPAPPRGSRRALTGVLALVLAVWVTLVGGTAAVVGAAVTLPSLLPGSSSGAPAVDPPQEQQGGSQSGGDSDDPWQTDPGTGGESQGSAAEQSDGENSSATVKAPSKGVVLIEATLTDGSGAGTGMVLTSGGEVLTNNHVVAGSSEVSVTIPDTGKTYSATVVGTDSKKDVALLQLKDASNLETVTIDRDKVSVGDTVVAFGNANGRRELVAAVGAVTGLQTSLTVSSESPWGTTENLTGMIQTSAKAVPGDSGGPMYDAQGEVLGMTTAGSTQAQVSYAVPINTALGIVQQIRDGDDSGSVRIGPAGYLGITTHGTVPSSGRGIVISTVAESSPAAKAGMSAGDILTAVGGTTITAETNVAALIRDTSPGDKVKISWVDAQTGRSHTATVTMGASPLN